MFRIFSRPPGASSRLVGLALISAVALGACGRSEHAHEAARGHDHAHGTDPAASQASSPANGGNAVADAIAAAGGTIFVCPMHPHIISDGPSACPICGMDLVPRDSGAAAAGEAVVSPALQQSLGVRVGHPQRRDISPIFRVAARVVPDATGVVRVPARSAGFVERLAVRAEGDPVRRGAVVAEIYSPDLVEAQEELLLGGEGAAGARERLRRLGVSDGDIDAVVRDGQSRRRLPVRSPVDGVVAELGAREGGAVAAGETLLEISPRSQVWIEALLFPSQRMQLGETVRGTFTVPGVPGRQWRAQASYIAPAVDAATQTLAVRFPIDEADELLPLGLWIDAEIRGAHRVGALVVPASAVIRTRQGDRVVTQVDVDRFKPVEVSLGLRDGEWVEVLEGLTPNDAIVLSGQFLLDSEAELGAGLGRMAGHDHGGTP